MLKYLETVVDEVSSGLDSSASNYIVSSSYANGTLVRSGGRTDDTTETITTTTTTTTAATTAATPTY